MAGLDALNVATVVRPHLPEPSKHCHICDTTKPRSEFNKQTAKKDGLQTRCRQCQADHSRNYFKEHPERLVSLTALKDARRLAGQAYVRDHLQSHPCVDCGENDWVILEFDHVRGKKRLEVAILVGSGYSLGAIKDEVAKCEVRCSNCHRRITYQRAGNWRIAPAPISL